MAFRQHARPPRPLSFSSPAPPIVTQELASSTSVQRKHPLEDDPEEWVLFSPSVAAPSTTATSRTPRTNGLSHLSDFGSLETAARSDQQDNEPSGSSSLETVAADQHGDDDDAGELDSLDDGLHAFHEPSEYGLAGAARMAMMQSADTVLPAHDGLGTFPASSSLLQEQLWQFEARPGHRRGRLHARRRSSVQRTLDALEEGMGPLSEEHERMLRIEKWRLEQSKALLEEIERETRRRRRRSIMSAARSQAGTESVVQEQSGIATPVVPAPIQDVEEASGDEETEGLSFLQRFTQRVIRDLMGIDEKILSVIFGEALPEEVELSSTPKPSAPKPRDEFKEILASSDGGLFTTESWEHRILERIARELGIIVHRLSEHPGAFETYLRTREPIPYAGLSATVPNLSASETLSGPTAEGIHSSINPQSANIFNPTLEAQQPATAPYSEASLWGIEEEPDTLEPTMCQTGGPYLSESQRLQQEREYWERDLDAKMVFRYLLRRFRSRSSSPAADNSDNSFRSAPPHHYSSSITMNAQFGAATTSVTTARRAALIRQNHPLVAHNHRSSMTTQQAAASATNRRHDLLHRHHYHHHHHRPHSHLSQAQPLRAGVVPRGSSRGAASATAAAAVVVAAEARRPGSSCASQSTKRSRKSGSSRNYWDLGGGSVGSWGEV